MLGLQNVIDEHLKKKNQDEKLALHSTHGVWQPHEQIRNRDKFVKYFEPWMDEWMRREREDDERNEKAETEFAQGL
jgi:hypothetical protein